MERRTFVKGAFGLAILAAGAGLGFAGSREQAAPTEQAREGLVYTTPDGAAIDEAVGPLMQGDIDLVAVDDDAYSGFFGNTELFTVDGTGVQLMELADGTRSLDGIADEAQVALGQELDVADVASFFVTLGQSGYLQNEVYVNLVENPA